jgi:Na+-translocating ferredoxin:NAD+ oxidoreductase RNF subunit RnfB
LAITEVYNKLEEKYGRGGYKHFIEILEAQMKPEEAQLLLDLSEPALHAGKVKQVSAPSRFGATVNQNLCAGCQLCVERCFFDAIEMQNIPNSKKLRAVVN